MRYLKLAILVLAYALISSPAFAQTCCPAGCAPEANRCVTTGPLWTKCIPIAAPRVLEGRPPDPLALRESTENARCSPARCAQRVLTWPHVRSPRIAH